MSREKVNFGVGLVIGILIAGLFFQFFAPRYTIVNSEDTLIKQDKRSGESWRFADTQWKLRTDNNNIDWQKVDQSLKDALGIQIKSAVDKGSAFRRLREKYTILKALIDDELQDRIRRVYSKEILTNLYLSNFLKLEKR